VKNPRLKKTFTIITILIALSLFGIIMIQVSWIKNMVKLREDQISQRVSQATDEVGKELSEFKSGYTGLPKRNYLVDDFTIDILKPLSVAKQFTEDQIRMKLLSAFSKKDLNDIHFEFGIVSVARNGLQNYLEKQSANFVSYYADSVNKKAFVAYLTPQSGTAGENLATDEYLIVVIPSIKSIVLRSLSVPIIMSGAFTIIIMLAFYVTVRTMLRQKKLGEIKNDFINNMTHEFKTPIATISLAVDAMRNEKVIRDPGRLGYFSEIIKEENQRMNRQVETILKASQLEKNEVNLNLKPLHVHEIIKDVVDNFSLQLEQKNGKVELDLSAGNDLVEADEVHFSNLVNNLVDNAVKYAKENTPPVVKLSTVSNGKNFVMRIEDNGIGMNRDTLKRIFERFYRAHTGNVHNVKGFGLGLSYVKTMVEAHDGDIKADSVLGKGTVFTVDLPLKKSPA
jgi:two-component system phosphate regulon sensor histidine kinase PhoR